MKKVTNKKPDKGWWDARAPIKGVNLTNGQMQNLKAQQVALVIFPDVKAYMEHHLIKLSERNMVSLRDLDTSTTVYDTIIESLPHVVWVADKDGSITYLNKAWITWTGRSIAESLGHNWVKALHPEDAGAQVVKWKSAYKDGKGYYGECRFMHIAGKITHCSYVGIPVKNRKGNVTNWIGIDIDITERKNYEKELKIKVQALEKQAEKLDELTASVKELTEKLSQN